DSFALRFDAEFFQSPQDFFANWRRKEVENTLCHCWTNVGYDAVLRRFRFGPTGKTSLYQTLGNFFRRRFLLPLSLIIENVTEQLGIGDIFDRLVKTGELRRRGFSHIGNGESEKPA